MHLEADLHEVTAWADQEGVAWAFTVANAGAYYTKHYHGIDELCRVKWSAVRATDFRDAEVKEGKQAEFLVKDFFPWHLVRQVGVLDGDMQARVAAVVGGGPPVVSVEPNWYY